MGLFDNLINSAINAGINAIKNSVQEEMLQSSDSIFITFSNMDRNDDARNYAFYYTFTKIAEIMSIDMGKGIGYRLNGGVGGVLYNGSFLVIQGIIKNGYGGITIAGENCYEISKQIVSILVQYGFIDIQYVNGPILFEEKEMLHSWSEEVIYQVENLDEENEEEDDEEDDERKLSLADIFNLTPKTNCKDCGCPSCMIFSREVLHGNMSIDECPYIE